MNTSDGFLGIAWLIWSCVALGIAILFAIIAPSKETQRRTTGLRFFVLRWFHSIVWLLLALSFFLRGANLPGTTSAADLVALLALAAYLVFIANLFIRTREPIDSKKT